MSAPTFEAYFGAAFKLAATVRKALDDRGSVTRGDVRKALEAFERIDKEAQVRDAFERRGSPST